MAQAIQAHLAAIQAHPAAIQTAQDIQPGPLVATLTMLQAIQAHLAAIQAHPAAIQTAQVIQPGHLEEVVATATSVSRNPRTMKPMTFCIKNTRSQT